MKRKLRHILHAPQLRFFLSQMLVIVVITFVGFRFVQTTFLSTKDILFAGFLFILLFGHLLRRYLPPLTYSDQPLSKVLVVQYDPFLSAGIEKSLQIDEDIVMRTINQPDEFLLVDEIYKFRPHTIVLAGCPPTINVTDLKMILNELDQVRLITVGVQDKNVYLFEKKSFKINKSEDFAFLMRGGSHRRMSIQEEGIYVKSNSFLWNEYIENFSDNSDTL